MTIIKKEQGRVGVYNEKGFQVEGSFKPNLTGLNPKELLEASLALCITITLHKMVQRDGMEVKDDEVSVDVQAIKASDSPSRFEKCMEDGDVTLPEYFSDEYKNKLIKSAEKACTIGNSLRKGLSIH
ncbi:OsmC family protein [Lentibacillus salinarum]|uniref:OsmC family protein n=1 Tax=Lentibacillus salinarum TaxID=446820 RepID=A0ABW3ZPC8_9BACI